MIMGMLVTWLDWALVGSAGVAVVAVVACVAVAIHSCTTTRRRRDKRDKRKGVTRETYGEPSETNAFLEGEEGRGSGSGNGKGSRSGSGSGKGSRSGSGRGKGSRSGSGSGKGGGGGSVRGRDDTKETNFDAASGSGKGSRSGRGSGKGSKSGSGKGSGSGSGSGKGGGSGNGRGRDDTRETNVDAASSARRKTSSGKGATPNGTRKMDTPCERKEDSRATPVGGPVGHAEGHPHSDSRRANAEGCLYSDLDFSAFRPRINDVIAGHVDTDYSEVTFSAPPPATAALPKSDS